MAQSFSLIRNARLFVTTVAESAAGARDEVATMTDINTWQIPILDGFSFTAETETEEITISEAGSTVDRGQQVFTTSIQPVNWSISNYMRPRFETNTANAGDAVERLLWEGLAASPTNNLVSTNDDGNATSRVGSAADMMLVDFGDSDVNQLITLSFLFDLGGSWWVIRDVVVNQAEIDFSIDSIASITWSGFGREVTKEASAPSTWVGRGIDITRTGTDEYLSAPSDNACIRNKLSELTMTDNNSPGTAYVVALTGGSLTINNNVEYLVPEALGQINLPCAHFTGPRQISGTVQAYLKTDTDGTADLLGDLSAATDVVTQDFIVNIYVGGSSSARPTVQFLMPHAHVSVPSITTDQVMGVDIDFTALPTDSAGAYDLAGTNELTVQYMATP